MLPSVRAAGAEGIPHLRQMPLARGPREIRGLLFVLEVPPSAELDADDGRCGSERSPERGCDGSRGALLRCESDEHRAAHGLGEFNGPRVRT